jgi:hypothetical protein
MTSVSRFLLRRFPAMRSLALLGGFWVLAVTTITPTVRAEVTAEQVRKAIRDGVEFLKREQQPTGNWGEIVQHPGGLNALITLALLNSGVDPEDQHVDRALAYLRKLRPEQMKSTYAVALQTMAFCKADPKRYFAAITDNARWLEETQCKTGDGQGGWGYGRGEGQYVDNSNSQFALLALHEAERVGVKIDGQTLRSAKDYWEDVQNDEDGSWSYRKGVPGGSGSMTCAGIGSLVITNDMIRQTDARVVDDRIRCCGKADREEEVDAVERGLQWLGKNFAVAQNPNGSAGFLLYYLYGVERVGRLTAQRFIGGRDWYREGADFLIRAKTGLSGSWKGAGPPEEDERIATALALLFLSKGRRPILLSKLKHNGDDWNQHRNDVNNLARYVESRWKLDLTWQVVDLTAATIDDLSQSPVLYYCGRDNPLPRSAADQEQLTAKIRGYLDRGGFLFAEAYCSGAAFDEGFRALMARVFPEREYRLKLLPPEHPIWRMEEKVDPDLAKPLLGIDFGCRTSVVYSPPDPAGKLPQSLSCLWEVSRPGRDVKYSAPVEAKVKAGLSIGINVLAYATNRQLQSKEAVFDKRPEKRPGDHYARGRLYIANLRHPGGCHAAPRALANLLDTAAGELNLRTAAEVQEINITDEALFDYHLVFMHGRNAFHLTSAERRQLKTFVERGGLVLANAICASRMFSDSFRREMEMIFPDRHLEPIPADDPLLTPAYGGFDLSTVTRRDPQQASSNEPLRDLRREVPPELEGVKLDDRYGVIFSRYDLSCALEKHDSPECQGYIREDAARIGLNVILYALQH